MKVTFQVSNQYLGYSMERIIRFLFCVTQIFNFVGYISNAMEMEGIFSLISQSYIVINVFSFILYLFSAKKNENVGNALMMMLLMAVSVLFSYYLNPGYCSLYELMLILCAYLSLPMYMLYVNEIKMTRGVLRCLYFSNMATAFFFLYSACFRPEYDEVSGAMTMGFFNPNQTAVFILQNLVVLLALNGLFGAIWKKRFILIICFIETYLIILTQSRAAAVCASVLFYFFFRKTAMISKKAIKFIAVLPVVFMSLLQYFADSEFLAGVEIFGKPLLSGREDIFETTLEAVNTSGKWMFGNFGEYLLENLHNAYLSVYASAGAIGLIVFFCFFYSQIRKSWDKMGNGFVSKMAFVGLLLLFVEGSVEAAIMVSGSMYAAASAPLIMLLNVKSEETENKEDV